MLFDPSGNVCGRASVAWGLGNKMADYQKVFEGVLMDARHVSNLDWGESRPGHPEGTVRAHIAEIEPNLEALRPKLSDDDYWKLKLLIHTQLQGGVAGWRSDLRSEEPRIACTRLFGDAL